MFISLSNGDFRLQSNSPCINAGNNTLVQPAAPVDSAGSPRTVGGTVDIGAFEFQAPGSTISYAWLQRFGLRTDGSIDFLDLDNDGHSTFQEWLADTNPTNAASVLRLVGITNQATGAKITWLSSPTKLYSLERATNLNLTQPFVVFTTVNGSASNTTSFTDAGARGMGSVVYRVSTYR